MSSFSRRGRHHIDLSTLGVDLITGGDLNTLKDYLVEGRAFSKPLGFLIGVSIVINNAEYAVNKDVAYPFQKINCIYIPYS